METYEIMLKKAYEKTKIVSSSGERFEIPKVSGSISGKNTIITNLGKIAQYIRRPEEHMVKSLLKELATSGKIDGERLILNSKLGSDKVNEKIQLYAKDFVICPECKKPDTNIITEKGIKFKHCEACGAKSPIKKKI